MSVSFHKYIDRLNRSGLLSTPDLQALLRAVPRSRRPRDTHSLSRWLVRQGHLTPFQAKAIYLGRTRGLIIGNYVILDLLGIGGMGQVYKAQHRRMKRIVALKLLTPRVARRPKLVQRFHQEVQAAARLLHPNIVAAFDADEAGGMHFLVMEYVKGRDLASLVKQRGPLSPNRSIRCVLDTARGLEFAHQHGIVHRDIKPSNLLLGRMRSDSEDQHTACVKILDMGLARIETDAGNRDRREDLTRTGIVMGTVDYMSPEQAVNTHDADHRSDIYSLGITLHFLLTGEVPFRGRTLIEQVLAHREAAIPSLRAARPDVPAALDSIFRRMVAKQPADRYQSMSDVVAALEGVLNGVPDQNESAAELPLPIDETSDEKALHQFFQTMSGDPTARQQAAAAVVTPALVGSPSETLIGSDRSTAIEFTPLRRQRTATQQDWKPLLIHGSWSIALLLLALWLLWTSRTPLPPTSSPPPPTNPTRIAAPE